jgi:hypothetical protein
MWTDDWFRDQGLHRLRGRPLEGRRKAKRGARPIRGPLVIGLAKT